MRDGLYIIIAILISVLLVVERKAVVAVIILIISIGGRVTVVINSELTGSVTAEMITQFLTSTSISTSTIL